ncbi:hypothetical protein ES705_14676 [subsurface metagenome]
MKKVINLAHTSFLKLLSSIHRIDPYPDHECVEYRSINDLLCKLQAKLWHNKKDSK